MKRLVSVTDTDCLVNLMMDRNAFGRLCTLCRRLVTLRDRRSIYIEQRVVIFLSVLAHHKKNRVTRFDFLHLGQIVFYYVHEVLRAIINMHTLVIVNPEPVSDDYVQLR